MKKILVLTLTMLFVMGMAVSAFAAQTISMKGVGSADKNYLTCFASSITYTDGASKIQSTLSTDGVLNLTYTFHKGGWIGAIGDSFMEDWSEFSGLTVNLAGGTNAKIRLELLDANGVSYEAILMDDVKNGKVVTVPFTSFKKRTDWQPAGVDKSKVFSLKPVVSLNISPLEGQGTVTFSDMKLYK